MFPPNTGHHQVSSWKASSCVIDGITLPNTISLLIAEVRFFPRIVLSRIYGGHIRTGEGFLREY